MGGTFWTRTVTEVTKEEVIAKWKEICNRHPYRGDIYDGFSSLAFGKGEFQFIEDPIFGSLEEAEEYILSHHKKWNAAMAVRYWRFEEYSDKDTGEKRKKDESMQLVTLSVGVAAE